MKKSIFKNFIYKILLSVSRIILPIILVPYIYRLFKPQIIGQVEFSSSIVEYFLIFSNLGIYTYGLREISQIRENEEEKNKIFTELFTISILSSSITLIFYFLYIFINFGNQEILKNMLLISSLSIVSNIFYVDWLLESFEDYKFIVRKTLFLKILNVILIFLFLKSQNDFYKYLILLNTITLLNDFIGFIYAKKYIKISFKNIKLKRHMFSLVTILLLNNTSILYTNFDKIALGFYSTSEQIAYYVMGQKVKSVIFAIATAIVTVSIPRLSFYLKEDKKSYEELLKNIISYTNFIIFPISFGVMILSEQIALFFGGKEYIAAKGAILIFGIRIIVTTYESILTNQVIFLHKKEKMNVMIIGICGVINLVFKVFLIKQIFRFNLTAETAIATTMISEILIIFINLYYIEKKLDLKIKIFDISQLKYLLISIGFIPIKFYFDSLNNNEIVTTLSIVFTCAIYYFLILSILKDKCFFKVLDKVTPQRYKAL